MRRLRRIDLAKSDGGHQIALQVDALCKTIAEADDRMQRRSNGADACSVAAESVRVSF
jgi:hypothetical protein